MLNSRATSDSALAFTLHNIISYHTILTAGPWKQSLHIDYCSGSCDFWNKFSIVTMQSALGLNLPIKQNVRIGCTCTPRRQVSQGPAGVAAIGKTHFNARAMFLSPDLNTSDPYCATGPFNFVQHIS